MNSRWDKKITERGQKEEAREREGNEKGKEKMESDNPNQ